MARTQEIEGTVRDRSTASGREDRQQGATLDDGRHGIVVHQRTIIDDQLRQLQPHASKKRVSAVVNCSWNKEKRKENILLKTINK